MSTTGKTSPMAEDFKEVLSAMLEDRNARAARVQMHRDANKAAKAQFASILDAATATATAEDIRGIEDIDRQLLDLLEKNRPRIRRWFGKTITLPAGQIKWRIIPRSLDVPEDESELIERLLKRKGGEEYLIKYYKLNMRKLATMSRWAQRRLGISSSRQEHLSFKPAGADKPVTLSKRRFPATPHIQD